MVRAALLLVASAWLGLAPAAAEAPQSAPRPALWLLADTDTKIYLFGTIHILPHGFQWRGPAINRAIEEADELVMELDQEEMEASAPELVQRTVADYFGGAFERFLRMTPG